MRIAIGGIAHETNTFATGKTTIDEFTRSGGHPGLMSGEQLLDTLRGVKVPTGGYIEVLEQAGIEMAPLIWTFAQPSGIVEQAAYERLIHLLLAELADAGPVDGVLLDLHGAMVTEELQDAEGDIISRVRRAVGPGVPIVSTLDLHANITAAMAAEATALIGYDTYPHVDCAQRGAEAARLLIDTVEGRVRPATGFSQVNMLIGPPKQCTLISPMQDVFALVHEIESRPGVLSVTFAGGFPFSDVRDAGAAVVVNSDGDARLAQQAADEVARFVWERREQFRLALTPPEQAIREAMASGEGPVILADGSDNPGGGAPCDGTVMLKALLDLGAPRSTVAIIADPEAVAEAVAAGVGADTTLQVGGKTDDRHGEPLELRGHVRLISDGRYRNRGPMMTGLPVDMGRAVVFIVGEVEIVLTQRRIQPFDMQALRSLAIEPTERLIIGLKSAVHFRADYGPIAKAIYDLDTPGVHSPDVRLYPYRRLRRPIWPLEEDAPSGVDGEP